MGKDSISIKNLCKNFKDKEVLKDLSYNFEIGNIYCIKGKNGSGKTTLFKILLKLINYNSGKINTNLKISGLIEEASGYKDISVFEQLIYLLGNSKVVREKIEEYAKLFNIVDALNKPFSKLSLGMKQKVALIYIFINDCDVILLDEPTISLDIDACHTLKELIIEKKKLGKCIIICSHDSYFLNVFKDSINLNLIDGKLEVYENNNLISIIIACRNPKFKDLLKEKSIDYINENNSYNFECDMDLINYIINKREEYEIQSITFR